MISPLGTRSLPFVVVAFAVTIAGFAYLARVDAAADRAEAIAVEETAAQEEVVETATNETIAVDGPGLPSAETIAPETAILGFPISRARERVTKKPFGIEIHPETSPVPGDRFNGFHVGVDFETFEDEADTDVPVVAICDGPMRSKGWANGYGGIAIQTCELEGEQVTIIYGHLALPSIEAFSGQPLATGERVGLLGKGGSEETDGVRKHLHLGIRKGTTDDIRGYIQQTGEIDRWIDALKYMAP